MLEEGEIGREREMEGRMTALEEKVEGLEEILARLEALLNHLTMERTRERTADKEKVVRLVAKVVSVRVESLGQLMEEWRRDKDAVEEGGVVARRETEKLRKELWEQM